MLDTDQVPRGDVVEIRRRFMAVGLLAIWLGLLALAFVGTGAQADPPCNPCAYNNWPPYYGFSWWSLYTGDSGSNFYHGNHINSPPSASPTYGTITVNQESWSALDHAYLYTKIGLTSSPTGFTQTTATVEYGFQFYMRTYVWTAPGTQYCNSVASVHVRAEGQLKDLTTGSVHSLPPTTVYIAIVGTMAGDPLSCNSDDHTISGSQFWVSEQNIPVVPGHTYVFVPYIDVETDATTFSGSYGSATVDLSSSGYYAIVAQLYACC